MSGEFWREHAATPRQKKFVFRDANRGGRRNPKATQADLLLPMLRDARCRCAGLELPAIMAAGIAQHGSRFNELRSRGFVIHNETKRGSDGRVLSRYYLRHDPERDGELK